MQRNDRSQSSLQCNRRGLGLNRKWLLGVAAVALIAGVAFNWSWLAAAGIAPLLIGILPCAAMCALHLCSKKSSGVPREAPATQGRPAPDIVAADR
jgi:hypothetical protein